MIPVSIPPSDIYSSLQKGIIEAMPVAMYELEDWNTGEILKYQSEVASCTPGFGITINLKKWNSLPADIQQIITDLGPWLVDLNDQVNLQIDRDRRASAIEKYNTQFIQIPQEELDKWAAVDKPVFDSLINELESQGYPGNKIRDEFLKLEKQYSAPEYGLK
jgi:TRAP-type C4-dicarboxylate transport system substrate-binding protein